MFDWLKELFSKKQYTDRDYYRIDTFEDESKAWKKAYKLYGNKLDGINIRVRKINNGVWVIECLRDLK